jgi:hypothetical protein
MFPFAVSDYDLRGKFSEISRFFSNWRRHGKRFHIRLGITVIVALWQLSYEELRCLLGQCKMLQVHQQQNENQFLGVWISMWDHIHYWLNRMVLFELTELVQV